MPPCAAAFALSVFIDVAARSFPTPCKRMTGLSQPIRPPNAPRPADGPSSSRAIVTAGGALALAAFAAYANSLTGPFVYDDKASLLDNHTLSSLWASLRPPPLGLTVSGRPVLNLSFAINHALGGDSVRGYHALNILFHALAGLTLFGLVRRTLLLPPLRARFGAAALPLAFTVAALWTLHPLQTEAVTYVVQRAESLMSLFYLLTLYSFLRSVQSSSPFRWRILALVSCLLGMATKENMVSAPVIVFLFDRAFVAGTFAEAWRRRFRFYVALASTWILLALLVASTGGNRDSAVGFGVGITWWDYTLTQFPALVRYLQLSFWPSPLVFDYGTFWVEHPLTILPHALAVAALLIATGFALWRKPMVGFLGAWFFAVLAPTSLLPGTTQMIVEHRMYLPLAALIALFVPALFSFGGRRSLTVLLSVAAVLGFLTARRNLDYRTELGLWADAAAKWPASSTAHCNVGLALADLGRTTEAIAEFETALRLRPDYPDAHNNLGSALTQQGRPAEGVLHFEAVLRVAPNNTQAHLNLGVALDLLQRGPEALSHYEAAARLKPELPTAQNNLGDALSRAGRTTEAIAHLEEALRLKPEYVDARYNLAAALVRAGRLPEAQAQFDAGFSLKPGDADALANWGNLLLATGHAAEAIAPYETTLRLHPTDPVAHYNHGTVLAALERYEEALREYEEAVRLKPDYAEAHNNLGNTLLTLNRIADAISHYETSLRLKPVNPTAHNNLGLALARDHRLTDAAAHFEEAVRQAPNYQEAGANLARARAALSASSRRD